MDILIEPSSIHKPMTGACQHFNVKELMKTYPLDEFMYCLYVPIAYVDQLLKSHYMTLSTNDTVYTLHVMMLLRNKKWTIKLDDELTHYVIPIDVSAILQTGYGWLVIQFEQPINLLVKPHIRTNLRRITVKRLSSCFDAYRSSYIMVVNKDTNKSLTRIDITDKENNTLFEVSTFDKHVFNVLNSPVHVYIANLMTLFNNDSYNYPINEYLSNTHLPTPEYDNIQIDECDSNQIDEYVIKYILCIVCNWSNNTNNGEVYIIEPSTSRCLFD